MAVLIGLLVAATTIAVIARLFLYQLRSQAIPASSRENTLVVLIPVLREQRAITETLAFFSKVPLPYDRYRIVVVTTEAEMRAEGTPTTAEVVDMEATRINSDVGQALVHRVHYPFVGGVMAHQVNYGVRYLFEAFEREIDPDKTLLAVFNADSRPRHDLLIEAAERASDAQPVLQAPAEYFLQSGRSDLFTTSICAAAAIWQTRWSLAVEYWRFRWAAALCRRGPRDGGRFAPSLLSPNAYVVGHGLFVRLRELIEVNYLPTFTPNEDAALGYLLPFYGLHAVPLNNEDRAEVPLQITQIVAQQAGWIVGPLCALQYAKYALRNGVSDSRFQLALAAMKVLWDAVVWILGPMLLFFSVLVSLFGGDRNIIALAVSFLIYLYVPSALLWGRASTMFPDTKAPRQLFILGFLALPIFYLLHGAGGLIGLVKLVTSHTLKRPYVKYKTER